jgi:hypothetical protein
MINTDVIQDPPESLWPRYFLVRRDHPFKLSGNAGTTMVITRVFDGAYRSWFVGISGVELASWQALCTFLDLNRLEIPGTDFSGCGNM